MTGKYNSVKDYYEKNKSIMTECACGSKYNKFTKHRHLTHSKQHKIYMMFDNLLKKNKEIEENINTYEKPNNKVKIFED